MKPKNLKAFILAAGFGSRLGELTKETPKVLLPFMNQPMLFHILEQIEKTEIKEVCINLHYKWEAVKEALKQYKGTLKIYFSIERKKILGTGGGIAAVDRWRKGSDLLVINADIIHTFDLNEIISNHYQNKAYATLALTQKPHPKETKIWCDKNRVVSFAEQTEKQQTPHGFACIHILSKTLLAKLPKQKSYSIVPIYQEQLKQGHQINAYVSENYWIDMGTPEKYLSSLFDFAARIKTKSFLDHPVFKDIAKSLNGYDKMKEELGEKHPELCKKFLADDVN